MIRRSDQVRIESVQCISPDGLHHMAYKDWGEIDNPNVLICVHGVTRVSDDFDTLARELSSQYRVICPDVVGRGRSGWLRNPQNYQVQQYICDMVTLLARVKAENLSYFGTSMGGMQTWLWGERYPDMMDGLMPIASQPVAVAGRNGFWRQMIIDAILRDPEWNDGNYVHQPIQWLRALPIYTLITNNAARMQERSPTPETARWHPRACYRRPFAASSITRATSVGCASIAT